MTTISEELAAKQFPSLIDMAIACEEIFITHKNMPILQLASLRTTPHEEMIIPKFGTGKGAILYMADDFDTPLDDFREYM